jgi:hypothetical protein
LYRKPACKKSGFLYVEENLKMKKMKNHGLVKFCSGSIVLAILILLSQNVLAQVPTTQQMPDTAKMTYNQISQACKLYVFPSNGQSQQQQKKDEFECYKWAMEQSGVDPLNLPKVEATTQSGPTGGAVKGAAKGAAAGAAIGAAAGGMGGLGRGQQAQAQQNQKSQANAAASEQEIKNSFVKAFSVCIEGKGYTVK